MMRKKEESRMRSKWQNPHTDRRILEWMLRYTHFINSMPLKLGPQAGNSLDPQ